MAGREGKNVGKAGRLSSEEKQRRITLEGKEGGKKIMFKLSEERLEKEEKRRITEVCKEILGTELRGLEEERKYVREEMRDLKEKIEEQEERLERIETGLEKIVEWIKKREEEEQGMQKCRDKEESERGTSSGECERENISVRSEGGTSIGSSLSVREVARIRKWVLEKDREDRKRNIVIKGIRMPKEEGSDSKKSSEWVERLIRNKLCVDVNVVGCRESGTVLVVRLESEEEKRKVMRNKYRLKGENIFVENDLSWEERNIQVKINKWVKDQKSKGLEVGIGRWG